MVGAPADAERTKIPALRLKSTILDRVRSSYSLVTIQLDVQRILNAVVTIVLAMDVDMQDVQMQSSTSGEQRTNALAGPSSQPDLPAVFLPPPGLYSSLSFSPRQGTEILVLI